MLDVSDRHFRRFIRLLSHKCELWTEMIVCNTIVYNREPVSELYKFLGYSSCERPLVCQLGGNDPTGMAQAAECVQQFGYNEININVGCPSGKVAGKGCFGAALMKTPETVRDIVCAIKRHTHIPVSVKTRIGVDTLDDYNFLSNFVDTVSRGGCEHFIVHSRKALLNGITPHQNRMVPPLIYQRVYQLCEDFPHLKFSLNGGVQTLEQAKTFLFSSLSAFDENGDLNSNLSFTHRGPLCGVMIGRAVMNNPIMLAHTDTYIYGEKSDPSTAATRRTLLQGYMEYLDEFQQNKIECTHEHDTVASIKSVFPLMKPILGIFFSKVGNKAFRHTLDTKVREYAGNRRASEILQEAMSVVDDEVLDELL